jgi:hypothetical protein
MVCTPIDLIFFESLSSLASISAARAERDEANITLQHCFYGPWPERQVVPILSCRQQKLPSRNYFISSWVAPLLHPCSTTTYPWIPRVTIRFCRSFMNLMSLNMLSLLASQVFVMTLLAVLPLEPGFHAAILINVKQALHRLGCGNGLSGC